MTILTIHKFNYIIRSEINNREKIHSITITYFRNRRKTHLMNVYFYEI